MTKTLSFPMYSIHMFCDVMLAFGGIGAFVASVLFPRRMGMFKVVLKVLHCIELVNTLRTSHPEIAIFTFFRHDAQVSSYIGRKRRNIGEHYPYRYVEMRYAYSQMSHRSGHQGHKIKPITSITTHTFHGSTTFLVYLKWYSWVPR